MRQVGTAETIGAARPRQHGLDPRQVGAPRRRTSLADASGDVDDSLSHGNCHGDALVRSLPNDSPSSVQPDVAPAAVIAGGAACVASAATGVSAGVPRPRGVASTIPAMAITTTAATAIWAPVREELRVGGDWRSSMTYPGLGATDSSWR
jgi:hypothetical protein